MNGPLIQRFFRFAMTPALQVMMGSVIAEISHKYLRVPQLWPHRPRTLDFNAVANCV